MTGGRRFTLSSPDWGHDHLSLDAVVAYVDDELTAGAHARAETHLASCPDCSAEVVAQLQARAALRTAAGPRLPSSLLHTLRSIPVEAELPPPPPGLGISADGQFVLLRDVPRADVDRPPGARWRSRRARVGAVSGLAIGALAVGALAVPGPAEPPAPGVLGGAVLSVPVPTRLSAGQAVPAGASVGRGPAVADPAVVQTPTGGPAAGEVTTSDDVTASADASSAVLDARLRARLDRSPVAFYHNP